MTEKRKAELRKLLGLMNNVAREITMHMTELNKGQAVFVHLYNMAQEILVEELK